MRTTEQLLRTMTEYTSRESAKSILADLEKRDQIVSVGEDEWELALAFAREFKGAFEPFEVAA